MEKQELYKQRLERYVTAMRCGVPDRVPIRLFAQEFAGKYCGVGNHEIAIDKHKAFEVTRRCVEELNVDSAMPNAIVNWFGMGEAIGWKGIAYPGVGIGTESVSQWHEPDSEETATLKISEYDEFAEDPTVFLMNKWLPRYSKFIQPLGASVNYRHNIALLAGGMSYLNYMNDFGRYAGELVNAGIVPANAGTLKAPLDLLMDKLRGYVNVCYDLTERPDKVLKACKALMPHVLKTALSAADPNKNVPVTIWMHRGTIPFVSPDVFKNIYWETLRPVVEEIWAQGHQILFYAEGNWDEHLDSFASLPDNSIIYHVDQGDAQKARKVFGNRFCLSGGVPNDILAWGTTHDVEKKCKMLIDTVASEGAYIMDASALIMDDAKVENIKAMVNYTLEHGIYNTGHTGIPNLPTYKNPYNIDMGKRPPGICIPWEEKVDELPEITGDISLVKSVHESEDAFAYSFLWTNLTW